MTELQNKFTEQKLRKLQKQQTNHSSGPVIPRCFSGDRQWAGISRHIEHVTPSAVVVLLDVCRTPHPTAARQALFPNARELLMPGEIMFGP